MPCVKDPEKSVEYILFVFLDLVNIFIEPKFIINGRNLRTWNTASLEEKISGIFDKV